MSVSNMVKLEKDATLIGVKYSMRFAMISAGHIWTRHGKQLVVTCGPNGEHSYRSYHPFGHALDFRVNFFGKEEAKVVFKELKKSLPSHYDVILHEKETDTGLVYYTHIHVEFDVNKYLATNPSIKDMILMFS